MGQELLGIGEAPGTYSVSLTAENASASETTTKEGYISVLACMNSAARVPRLGRSPFAAIASGYAAAADGDLIQLQALEFPEQAIFDRDIRIGLSGGYDCSYADSIAASTISGVLRVKRGTVALQKLRFKWQAGGFSLSTNQEMATFASSAGRKQVRH